MKRWISLSLLLAVAVLGAPLAAQDAAAETVSLSGKLVCAKCTLKLEGFDECQDVLVVEGEEGAEQLYFVAAPHQEGDKVEHTCRGERAVTMEGTLAAKDGKTWITPTKVEDAGAGGY